MDAAQLTALTRRATGLVRPGRRAIVGVCGAPGVGKSTVAVALVKRLNASGIVAARVPMDGFHLADAALVERDLLHVKGSIETFDVHGYLALLRRLRDEVDHDVLAPDFERTLEQPIAAAITVSPVVQIVVTEGNYLLDDDDVWPAVRAAMDEVWFVNLDEDRRRSRLVARHVAFGKERNAAQAWVDEVDEPNARRVIARRAAADLVIEA